MKNRQESGKDFSSLSKWESEPSPVETHLESNNGGETHLKF